MGSPKNVRVRSLLVLLLSFLLSPTYGQPTSTSFPPTYGIELKQRVTFSSKRISLGALLENLAQQSGIAVSASDRDGAASEMVCVSFREMPLSEVMDALQSLLSYRAGEWRWEIIERQKTKSYRLVRTPAAQHFAETLGDEIDTAVLYDYEAMVAVRDSPKALEALATTNEFAKYCLGPLGKEYQNKVRAFTQLFDRETRRQLMLGQMIPPTPIVNLTEAAKAFANTEIASMTQSQPALKANLTHLHSQRSYLVGELTPTISLLLGNQTGRIGSAAIGGVSIEVRWREEVQRRWLQKGEVSEHPPFEAQLLPKTTEKRRRTDPFDQLSAAAYVTERWMHAAEVTQHPFFASLSLNNQEDLGPVGGQTLGAVCKSYHSNPMVYSHKWRGNALLLRSHQWIRAAATEVRIPFTIRKELSRRMKQHADFLWTLDDILYLIQNLNDAQLALLSEEAGVHGSSALVYPSLLVEYRPLLTFLISHPSFLTAARTGKEIEVSALSPEARAFVFSRVKEEFQNKRLLIRVSVIQGDRTPEQPKESVRSLVVDLIDPQGEHKLTNFLTDYFLLPWVRWVTPIE